MSTHSAAITRPARRRWLWRGLRWGGIAMVIILLLAGVLLWIVTRSWFLVSRITPVLEHRMGGAVQVDRAVFQSDGVVVLHGFTLRTREHIGAASEVATIGRAVVQLDLDELWSGRIAVQSIALHDVLLRMSEDAHQSGRFTFMSLDPAVADTPHEHKLPPHVAIYNAVLEYGMYDGATYQPHGQRRVAGEMYPAADEEQLYVFQLSEIDEVGQGVVDGVFINGRWHVLSNQYASRIDGLELNQQTYDMCPQLVRLWWDRMELQGRLTDTRVRWNEDAGLQIASDILDVGLTLPVEAGDWSRYHEGHIIGSSGRQRMRVNSGQIRLRDGELRLEHLRGGLKSQDENQVDSAIVPYTISMTMSQLPNLDWANREQWMDNVLAHTPFHVKFEMDDFHVVPDAQGNAPAVDLPSRVAEILERFQIKDWTLSTTIDVTRAPAVVGDDGALIPQRIESRGQLYIVDAAGSFEKFPYPLIDVDAHLVFDQDRAVVNYVTGRTDDGVTMRLMGEIAPLGRYPGVSLKLVGSDVPVNKQLRDALPPEHISVFDHLLHQPSAQRLHDAGTVVDEVRLQELRQKRRDVHRQLTVLQEEDRHVESAHPFDGALLLSQSTRLHRMLQLQRQAIQLDALLEAGVFELGGKVDLIVHINREPGADQPTRLHGEVFIDQLHAVLSYFPYPFTIRGGTVQWSLDGAEIIPGENGSGLSVITQGGGRGRILGSFVRHRIEDGPDRVEPKILIDITNDSMTELIYQSIPTSQAERDAGELAQSAQLLQGLGLDGALEYQGAIREDEQGEIAYRFDVQLVGGTAHPHPALAEALGAAGLLWPQDWSWTDVHGQVRITRDTIELEQLTGYRDDGRVQAMGMMDLRQSPPDASLDVQFHELTLGRYLIDLFPSDSIDLARNLWERYQPQGSFNAHLQFHRRAGAVLPPRLFIEPLRANVVINDEPVTMLRQGGQLTVRSNTVVFEDLALSMQRGDVDDGVLHLNGSYGIADEGDALVAQGTWIAGRLESPVISEMLRLVGDVHHAQQLEQLQATGKFDVAFEYASQHGGQPPRYQFDITPIELALSLQSQQMQATFEPTSHIRITPNRVALEQVIADVDGGQFHVGGLVRMMDPVEASLRINYSGKLMSESVQALLPRAVQQVMQEIAFEDGGLSEVRDAVVRFARVPSNNPPQWQSAFRGTIVTNDASMNPGVSLASITGRFDLDMMYDPDQPLQLRIDTDIAEMRAMDQRLTNVTVGNFGLTPDGHTLLLENIHADAYGGDLTAQIRVGLDDNLRYAADVNFVGLSMAELFDDVQARPSRGTHGELFGSIQLAGVRGQPELRSGRGSARALGRSLGNLPLVFQIMQVTQLNVPLQGDPDYADLIFYIDGERLVFERILLESTVGDTIALQLIGSGEMNLDSRELNTQFRSRSGMLVIRDFMGGLSDQLYLIEVTGTLGQPRARIVPLPGLTQPDRAREAAAASRVHPR